MDFCPKCGNLLIPEKNKRGNVKLVCSSCTYKDKAGKGLKIKEKIKKEEKHFKRAGEELLDTLPKTMIECPECGNKEAYWWTLQTRAADEPETQFYRCTKCRYIWRVY